MLHYIGVGLFFFFTSAFWVFNIFITYILPIIVVIIIINEVNKSKNLELGDQHVEVVKKYKEALESLDKHKHLKTYKEIINTIFKENVKLYKESLPIRKAYKKLSKVKEDLKMELQRGVNGNNRMENTKKLLFKTTEKLENLDKYLKEVDDAIESTSIDFVNLKAELELKQVSPGVLPNLNLAPLKEKANTLTYLQKNLPAIND